MPKLIATHDVDDIDHWLASPKRAEVFAGIATNLQTYVLPGDGKKVALSMEVADMDALEAMLKSEAGAAAMKYDGVHPETVVIYVES